SAVKAGSPEVRAPVYSHHTYDIVPGAEVVVRSPDVLIVEGLNVLQPARPRHDGTLGLAISDYFDFSVYVDARSRDIKQWYVSRCLDPEHGAFPAEQSYLHRSTQLADADAVTLATVIWESINPPNRTETVQPSRGRADLVLHKSADHTNRKVPL